MTALLHDEIIVVLAQDGSLDHFFVLQCCKLQTGSTSKPFIPNSPETSQIY